MKFIILKMRNNYIKCDKLRKKAHCRIQIKVLIYAEQQQHQQQLHQWTQIPAFISSPF